jgi:hypothetical protein
MFHVKREYLLQNGGKFNTIFIGSSRIYRHIDPELFDKETAAFNTKSFNMGSPALYPPESYFLYEQLLTERQLNLKYVIVELGDCQFRDVRNLQTVQVKYWYTPAYYLFSLETIIDSHYKPGVKLEGMKYITVNYIEKLFCIGLFREIVKYKDTKPAFIWLGEQGNGYLSFVEQMEKKMEIQELLKRKEIFSNNTNRIVKMKRRIARMFNKFKDKQAFNESHLKKINRLLALSEQKGVHLIFLLTPRLPVESYGELLPLYKEINDNHKIELADSSKYVEFYRPGTSFDHAHLNGEGTAIFTKRLAGEFTRLVKNRGRKEIAKKKK